MVRAKRYGDMIVIQIVTARMLRESSVSVRTVLGWNTTYKKHQIVKARKRLAGPPLRRPRPIWT